MAAQSTHTKSGGQRGYVPVSSRKQRNAATFVAQLQAYVEKIDELAGADDTLDIARGNRIKARRDELHLTQPAVVDLLAEAAQQLPASHDLHPDNAGKAPVTLRGYQTYERGGGIVWEKAKLLAQVLGMDVQALMNGQSPAVAAGGSADIEITPSPFAGQDQLSDRLDRIEQALASAASERGRIVELLARQDQILESIQASIRAEKQAKAETAAARRDLLAAVDVANRALLAGAPRTEEAPEPRAT